MKKKIVKVTGLKDEPDIVDHSFKNHKIYK